MSDLLHFAPNSPVLLSLVDPEGEWDADMRQGTYQTTCGQTFVLPRQAVILLNQLEPRPNEEIQITRHWKGRKLDPITWTICLSPTSEKLRAAQEQAIFDGQDPATLMNLLEASIEQAEAKRPLKSPPTLITPKKPPKSAPPVEPRLFDPGTGTDGPAPAPKTAPPIPAAAASPVRRPAAIPWNVAFREVSAWVAKELAENKLQWSDEAQQAMVCTCLIAEVKAGRIGPWEREG